MMDVMLVGATGLVGAEVLTRLLATDQVQRVIAPTRRPLRVTHAKLINPQVDFDALPVDASWWAVNGVICTLGTTMRKAGSRDAFYRVDHDYPLAVAELALARGATIYALNSAAGADPDSRIFYNRVKGDVERDLTALGFPSVTLVRPGLIGGDRAEQRAGETFALHLLRALRPVLPRALRICPATRIADALVQAVLDPQPAVNVVPAVDLSH